MEAKDRAILIDATETMFARTGHDLYEGARRIKQWVDERYPLLEASQSREGLNALLAHGKETDMQHLLQAVALLQALPSVAEQFVDQGILKAAQSIPTQNPGRRRIEPETKRKIVDAVGRLHMQGVPIGTAQSRAAQKFGLGKRSIQRVWRERQHLAEQPFQTMDDIWRFLAK
jgi:hypothetical protein